MKRPFQVFFPTFSHFMEQLTTHNVNSDLQATICTTSLSYNLYFVLFLFVFFHSFALLTFLLIFRVFFFAVLIFRFFSFIHFAPRSTLGTGHCSNFPFVLLFGAYFDPYIYMFIFFHILFSIILCFDVSAIFSMFQISIISKLWDVVNIQRKHMKKKRK